MSDQRILDKLEEMDKRLDTIDLTLVKQHVTLEEHIRRSLANEEAVEMLREEIKPIQAHVNMINGALKLLGGIALCLAAFESVKNLFS